MVFSQIVFYSVFSLVAIIIGVLLIIFIYYLISLTKDLKDIVENFQDASKKTGEKIKEIINALSQIPILSLFLNKKNNYKIFKKGRK